MDKEAQPKEQKTNYRNYFRYEMKDTNQLLKDFIFCNKNCEFLGSEPAKHQIGKSLLKIEEASVSDSFQDEKAKNEGKEVQKRQQVRKKAANSEDDLQNEQNQSQKYLIEDSSFSLQRKKKRENSMEDLVLQKFNLSSSQNQDFDDPFRTSIQKYKSKESLDHNTFDRYEDSNKQVKKQRKGLANISIRVKNIVSQYKKLTYRQVSDYVLQYSQQEISLLDPIQRSKQIKNIKRRVYDALNVLVAVGILGKHQRCVCTTEWTQVPGKKHSSCWNKINTRIQYLNKLKTNCIQKQDALNYHIEKYHAITALRNKHIKQEKSSTLSFGQSSPSLKLQNKSGSTPQSKQERLDSKLVFPVIVFLPGYGDDSNQELTVQLEQGDQNQSKNGKQTKNSKFKVSGKNMTMMGDFDCALEMDLQKFRISEQEEKIINQIEDYAKQAGGKRFTEYKFQGDDLNDGSIEEYFNEQMFQSK